MKHPGIPPQVIAHKKAKKEKEKAAAEETSRLVAEASKDTPEAIAARKKAQASMRLYEIRMEYLDALILKDKPKMDALATEFAEKKAKSAIA